MGKYRISELNIEILSNSKTLLKNLEPFQTDFDYKPNLNLSMTDDVLLQYMEEYEGYTADVIECVYLSTEFSRSLFDFNGFPVESTALEYNGSAVLFCAPNEDYNIFEQIPGENIFSVDYTAVRQISTDFFAYGTPFGLNGEKCKDKKVPLKSIVFVDKERFDSLKQLDTKDMVYMFITAVTHSIKSDRTKHTLFMLEKLMKKVKFYGVSDLKDLDFVLERVTEE